MGAAARALKAKDCVYRIYRDTRFSTDKTPYKIYFSAAFSPWGRKTHRAAYYMQMDVRDAESGLYGGVWCPDAPFCASCVTPSLTISKNSER